MAGTKEENETRDFLEARATLLERYGHGALGSGPEQTNHQLRPPIVPNVPDYSPLKDNELHQFLPTINCHYSQLSLLFHLAALRISYQVLTEISEEVPEHRVSPSILHVHAQEKRERNQDRCLQLRMSTLFLPFSSPRFGCRGSRLKLETS